MGSLDSAAHVVQVALIPIFMLTGIGSLLNVFSARLGRISDRVDLLSQSGGGDGDGGDRELRRLGLRSMILDGAVLLGAVSGALTCAAALALLVAVLGARDAFALFELFGGALGCAIAALAAFAVEAILAGRSLRAKVRRAREK
jgi:hypothetical protein